MSPYFVARCRTETEPWRSVSRLMARILKFLGSSAPHRFPARRSGVDMRSDPRTQPRPRWVSPRWLAALFLAASLVTACGEREAERSRPGPPPVIPVSTVAVARGEVTQRISVPGTLAALRQSRIGAEVGGRIEAVFVREGDRVEAGAPLFRVDPEPYQLALRQARAGRDLARAERQQIELDLGRARDLRGRQIVAQQHVERIETQLAVARAQEAQATERVRMAELEVRRTTVRAPFAGSVAKRLADEGTTALRQPQTIVILLQETHELDGRATIPEAYMSAVRVGDRAVVSLTGVRTEIETEISAVSDVVDAATRTYEVRMRVPNPDYALKAGVFAEVTIHPVPRTGVLLVPREAIRTEEGRTRVLVFRDGLAVAVAVELGVVAPDAAEVLSGLEAGERVIVGEEAQTVAPGMAVREIEALAATP